MDLSKDDLDRKFLRPYRRAEVMVLPDGRLPSVKDLVRVQIMRTSEPSEVVLKALQVASRKQIDDLNAGNEWVTFVSPGYGWSPEDIVLTGDDVTTDFVTAAPGSGLTLGKFLSDGWTITIGGGLVLLVIGLLAGLGG